MTDRSTTREAGFTLVEVVIALAIVAATVAAGVGLSLGSRSLAVSTAANEFDQFLDSARTIARSLDGAVLAFMPDAYGDGTEVRLLSGVPNDEPAATTLPSLHARATIEEAESLGKVPFAFVVHANGSLSGRPGYRVGDSTKNDVGCPPSGAFHFVIKAAGGSAHRYVPCRMTLANTGPATLSAWPWATTAPLPTPCGGAGCTATSLPNVPTSTPSCPPAFTPTAGGCTPSSPPGAGPRYHVTIAGAPATINVGATGSLTAQATLTNASAVPAGTPSSIPVQIQTADPTCAITPTGWQPSGSTFTITGIAPGTCRMTAQSDVSGISEGVSDTATVSVAIIGSAGTTQTPTPPQCDLVSNGKCYRRIVNLTTNRFSKTVSPDSTCDSAQPDAPCRYLDSIRSIGIDAYSFKPPIAPSSSANELLFRIDSIDNLILECIPYSDFAAVNATDPLPLSASAIGGQRNPPVGFGEPSVFATVNHVFTDVVPAAYDEKVESLRVVPTVSDMVDALLRAKPGLPFSFTFSSADALPSSNIVWIADFPSCDNAGYLGISPVEFGTVFADYSFEIFQALEK